MSDLHLDFPGSKGIPPLVPDTNVVIVAGDTMNGLVGAIELLRDAYPEPVEIVMVAGNHEFYSKRLSYYEQLDAGREAAARRRVNLLENEVRLISGIRFLGCTLWTDYLLFGEMHRRTAMRTAAEVMRDHRRIKWRRDPWQRFRPEEALRLHQESRAFLERELLNPHPDCATVCVFHHAVTLEAVSAPFRESIATAAYASDLQLERFQVDLVVTGHTHHNVDFRLGRTRFVSNAAGYADENPAFDPSFTLELPDV